MKGEFAQPSKGHKNIMNMIVYKILFCFLSLLTALIVKNNHILAGIYFIFLKKVLDQT